MSEQNSKNVACTSGVETILSKGSSEDEVEAGGPVKVAAAGAAGSPHFGARDFVTDAETASSAAGSSGGLYEVIEYDPTDESLSQSLLNEMEGGPTIEENSPAFEAILANANVHVSSMGKAARAVHMQTVRKLVKRATGTNKSGFRRGKPPRIPPMKEEDELPPVHVSASAGLETVPEAIEEERKLTSKSDDDGYGSVPEDGHIPDSVVAGTVQASKEVLGDVDPHGLLKLLRWRRKRKNRHKVTLNKSYVKGKVIDGEHELYTLSIAVMIGVRTSISKTNNEINAGPQRRWVRPQDFRTTEKYEFRPKGGSLTPPHQLAHTFKFKDYSPVVFAYLRRIYGVNEFDFLLSVCGNANFIEFISNAKSGQFFFYSSDGRFMIKTMTNAESKFLRRILPQYFRHCAENPNTMITRFFGMYRVKLYHLRRNVKFVIMNSVYYTDKYLQTFYDLKGSSVGRDAKPGQAVKKDNDLRRGLPDEALALPPKARSRVREQLLLDCKFLEKMDIMDYSMLVGVHHIPQADDNSIATSGFRGSRSSSRVRKPRREDDFGEDSASHHDADTLSTSSPIRRLKTDKDRRSKTDKDNVISCSAPTPKTSSEFEGKVHPDKTPASFAQPSPEFSSEFKDNRIRHNSETMHRNQLNEIIGAFFQEDGLDDDDNSYLLGSEARPDANMPYNAESERKKQVTIEKLYWPFHRLYDIHGYRRMHPVLCPRCREKPCACYEKEDAKILRGYRIPKFVPPLSNRKDHGLEMDVTGFHMPMIHKGPHGPQPYEGKIFYMGIIDILQEYTSRKVLEARYRFIKTHGRPEASCVPPQNYGSRFLGFFDVYTQRTPAADVGLELNESGDVITSSNENQGKKAEK